MNHDNKPHVMPSGPSAYFDVDDTLIQWQRPTSRDSDLDLIEVSCRGVRDTYKFNKHNLDYLNKLASRGHVIILWSAGGADWAQAVCDALSLNEIVFACLSKPTYYVDDIKDPTQWLGKHKFCNIKGEWE